MTAGERRRVRPRLAWGELALAPLSGLLAAVPAVVVAGLPLYLFLWLTGFDEPGRWVRFVAVAAFAGASAMAMVAVLAEFLRARARIDDDLLADEVEERVVHVVEAIEVLSDPPALFLRTENAVTGEDETLVLRGDYVGQLRRTQAFPSTLMRLLQLPASRAVVGVLPLGEPLPPLAVSGSDYHPVELDGQATSGDLEWLRAMAS